MADPTDPVTAGGGQSVPGGADARPIIPISTIPAWAGITNAKLANTNTGALSQLQARGGTAPTANQETQISQGYALAKVRSTVLNAMYLSQTGGQPIKNLIKGGLVDGVPGGTYERFPAVLPTVFNNVVAAGGVPFLDFFMWNQGEGDLAAFTRGRAYNAYFRGMLDDLHTDLASLAGGPTLRALMVQTCQWGIRGGGLTSLLGPNPIGLEQKNLADTNSDIFLATPNYPFEFITYINPGDGLVPSPLHLSPRGQVHLGEVLARIQLAILAGAKWQPVQPVYAIKGWTHVDVLHHVPVAPLRFDTTTRQWGDAGPHKGFSITNSFGIEVPIDRAEILPDGVTVRLHHETAGPVPGRLTINYGLRYLNVVPIPGRDPVNIVGIGNLCDSETAVSAYDGARLSNWAVHSSVTAEGGAVLKLSNFRVSRPSDGGLVAVSNFHPAA